MVKPKKADPAQVTAAQFIAALLPKSPNAPQLGDACVVVSSPFTPKDDRKLFPPVAYHEGVTYGAELYVNWATCRVVEYVDGNGYEKQGVRATNAAWEAQYFLMLDDVGDPKKSSLTLDDPRVLAASYLLETSAGNYQVGYKFEVPLNAAECAQLRAACVAASLGDKGSLQSPHRWCRVPGSVNVKPERAGWKSVLREWHPGRVYTLLELCALLGVDLDATVAAPGESSITMPPDIDKYQDAHWRWLRTRERGAPGSIIGSRSSTGYFPVVCPWCDEHSATPEAGYRPGYESTPPAFKCHHSHGEQYRTAQFIEWCIEEQAAGSPDEPAPEIPALPASEFWNFEEIISAPYPDWLLEEMFARKQVGAVFGEPYAGKSALAFSITMALAGGAEVLGDIEQWEVGTGAVYFALEGNLRTRTEPYRREGLLEAAPRIRFERTLELELDDQDGFTHISALVSQAKELDPRTSLVVIDTLARASGVDENTADMGKIAEFLRQIAEEFDVCVLVVHHSGKDQSKGLRGHSSFFAALDFAIEVTVDKDQDGKVLQRRFAVTKQREGEGQLVREFEIRGVELGKHPKRGTRVSGPLCIVKPGQASRTKAIAAGPKGGNQRKVYDVLRTLVLSASRHPEAREFAAGWGVPTATLIEAATFKLPKKAGHDRRREDVLRALRAMKSEHVWYEDRGEVQYTILPGKESK